MKIEIRKTCKICEKPIVEKRFRTYCSAKCRNRFHNQKAQPQRTIWQRKRYDKIASKPDPNKIKCLVCGKYYVQVGSHIYSRHNMTAREYRENYGFDVKRGQLPEWYREIKADHVFDNGTVLNLRKGEKFWFKPGSETAGRYERSEQTKKRLKNQFKK